MHTHAIGRLEPGHDAVIVRRRHDGFTGNHAVGEELTRSVRVGEESLEREHALSHAALNVVPVVGLDQAGDDVEGKRPLLAGNAEGDALLEIGRGQRVGTKANFVGAHLEERFMHGAVVVAYLGVIEHLVKARDGAVTVEEL